MSLTPEDLAAIEAIVERVVAKLADMPTDPDPLFDRAGAAAYLTLTVRTFDRERLRVPARLRPADETGPLSRKWRKSTLDCYKLAGMPLIRRRTRRAA